ncbi:RICIN domain-containing protein [Streptomyces exfoliatus]|uniref:RICIN domain-containing protein n=1 Tax=Streptomyces exfoliatus TaxID=1905 RepID=UPI003C2CCC8A
MRRIWAGLLSLLAVLTLSATNAPTASAVSYTLQNVTPSWGRLCATPQGNSTANGTIVTTWSCTGSNLQQWYWAGPESQFLIHQASGKCLTPQGNASEVNGTVLTLWTCDFSYGSPQRFIEAASSGEPGQGIRIYTKWGGKCITNYGGSFGNGVYLTLWSCAPDYPKEQYWFTGWWS